MPSSSLSSGGRPPSPGGRLRRSGSRWKVRPGVRSRGQPEQPGPRRWPRRFVTPETPSSRSRRARASCRLSSVHQEGSAVALNAPSHSGTQITDVGNEFLSDPSDPTAGRVAMARELASENVRMIADPAPLGLGCFALTTFLLSLFNAGLLPATGEPIVFGVALAYGGVAQVLAGMWEFRKGNVFGATAFTSYGAFWLSFWAFVTFYAADIADADDRGTAVGWYLIGWGLFTVVLWVASLRTTAVLALLFTFLAATFFLLGIGDVAQNKALVTLGGYLGLVTAAVAWYACLAGVTASTFGRTVLPTPPLYKL